MSTRRTNIKELTAFIVTHLTLEGKNVDFNIINEDKSVVTFLYENGIQSEIHIELKDGEVNFYNEAGENISLEV